MGLSQVSDTCSPEPLVQNCIRRPCLPTKIAAMAKNRKFGKKIFKKSSPETAWPIWTKLWWKVPWVVPFQNCIHWTRGLSKMATISGHSFSIGPYGKNNDKSSCLKQLDQWGLNFNGMVLGWSPFRIVSVGPVIH